MENSHNHRVLWKTQVQALSGPRSRARAADGQNGHPEAERLAQRNLAARWISR